MEQLAAGELPAGAAQQQQLAQSSAELLRSMSGWDGANRSSARGFIYWPGLDAKRELDSYSRRELLVKSRWLRANQGLPNRLVRGLADLIGYLSPWWDSGDEKWDRVIEDHWEERMSSPLAADASGIYSMKELQVELDAAAFGDGDVLPVVIESERSRAAQIMLYESPQVVSPKGLEGSAGWHEGIKLDRFRRHLAYGVRDGDGEKVRIISARDAFWYGHPDALGRVRPPTILARAINHLVDVSEIVADWKLSIKIAAQLGLVMKKQLPGSSGYGAQGFFTGVRNERVTPAAADETEEGGGGAPASDGSDDKDLKVEDFYAGGGVASLPPGMDLVTIQDDRPHPNALALLDFMIRDVAWGVGASPELVYNISGLRGASNRWAGADLGRWIGSRLLRKRSFMRRFCGVWAAKEIREGRVPAPAGGKFWRVDCIPQADLTVDKGRDGKLNIDLVGAKLRSLRTHFGEEGRHWLREMKQIKREEKAILELREVAEEIDAA